MMRELSESWQTLIDLLSSESFLGSYEACSEYDAVVLLWHNDSVTTSLNAWIKSVENGADIFSETDYFPKKTEARLAFHKKNGNDQFIDGNYTDAIISYNEGLTCAPGLTLDYYLVLSNRANVLIKLGEYERALVDLSSICIESYPAEKRYKLFNKFGLCYLNLGNKEMSKAYYKKALHSLLHESALNQAQISPIERVLERMIKTDPPGEPTEIKVCPSIPEQHKYLEGAMPQLKIKYTEAKGRHIAAAANIKEGQIIFAEEPFAIATLPDEDYSLFTCDKCCKVVKNQYTCDRCPRSHYCSPACKQEAWSKFHMWECVGSAMRLWETIGIAQLAMKVFLTGSLSELYSVENIKIQHDAYALLNAMMDEEHLNINYSKIIHLVTNFKNMTQADIKVYGLASIMIVLYLKEFTTFFPDRFALLLPNMIGQEQELFATCLIFKHVCQMVCNSTLITKIDRPIATGIYPSSSLMNHSCLPNTTANHFNNILVITAAMDINEDTEIFNCYGLQARLFSKAYRRQVLRQQYGFACRCSACHGPAAIG